MTEVDFIGLWGYRNAIDTMRRHGMNETLIACVVQDIRSATINEEFRRIVCLIEDTPPQHHHRDEIEKTIGERWSREISEREEKIRQKRGY